MGCVAVIRNVEFKIPNFAARLCWIGGIYVMVACIDRWG